MIVAAVLVSFLTLASADHPMEGDLEPFLSEPAMDIQRLYDGSRMPNVVVALDGTVLCVFRDNPMVRRSEDGGMTWGGIIDIGNGEMSGGVTVNEGNGDIFVFIEDDHPPAPLTVYKSTDHGKTWNEWDVEIKPDVNGDVLSMHMNEHGITLRHGEHAGRIIRAARNYAGGNDESNWPEMYTSAIYSDDSGKIWHASAPFPAFGTGEAAMAELSDGSIYYNSRRHWAPEGVNPLRRWSAWSYDGGETWIDLAIVDILPDGPQNTNYGCMGGLVRLPVNGMDIILYSNPDSDHGREKGTVWVSFDGAQTWPLKRRINEGEFAYSSLNAGRPGTPSEGWIYLHFESSGSNVARFNLSWLLEGEATGDGEIPEYPAEPYIRLDKSSVSTGLDDEVTITATVKNAEGGEVISWEITDGSGLLSGNTGESVTFTPDGEGTSKVTASLENGRSSTCTIKVIDWTTYHVKINSGGGAVEDWVGDGEFVSGGSSFDWGESIDVSGVENAGPAQIYETVRHTSPHSYTFPVVDGDYIVRIHFVDRLTSLHRDVTYTIEGTEVESGISIPEGPEVREYNVTVSDGNGLTIECIGNGESDVFEAGIEVTYDGGSTTESYMAGFNTGVDGLRVRKISGGKYRISALSGKEPFSARIVSVNGTVVESFSGRGSGVWAPRCASGLYFVDVVSGDRRFREKILVQR